MFYYVSFNLLISYCTALFTFLEDQYYLVAIYCLSCPWNSLEKTSLALVQTCFKSSNKPKCYQLILNKVFFIGYVGKFFMTIFFGLYFLYSAHSYSGDSGVISFLTAIGMDLVNIQLYSWDAGISSWIQTWVSASLSYFTDKLDHAATKAGSITNKVKRFQCNWNYSSNWLFKNLKPTF